MLAVDQLLAMRERVARITELLDQAVDAALLSPDEGKLIEVERLLTSQLEAIRFEDAPRPPANKECCDDRR
jgi:hypothetical protein